MSFIKDVGGFFTTYESSLESETEGKRRRVSRWGIYLIVFTQGVCSSMLNPSVWPYLAKEDKSANLEFYGMLLSATQMIQFSLGPVMGAWIQKVGSCRPPLIFCTLALFVGNVWYALIPLHGAEKKWIFLVVKLLFGTATAGSIFLIYFARETTRKERSLSIIIYTFTASIGYLTGQFLTPLLTLFGEEGISLIKDYKLSMYTSIGWTGSLLAALSLITLHNKFFNECGIAIKEVDCLEGAHEINKNDYKDKYESKNENTPLNRHALLKKVNYVALLVIGVSKIASADHVSVVETLAMPVALDQFGWSSEMTVSRVSLFFGIASFITYITYFQLYALVKKGIEERKLLLFAGFMPMILGRLLFFPYFGPNIPEKLIGCESLNGTVYYNLEECELNNLQEEVYQPGCSYDAQPWCENMIALNPYLAYIGHIITSFGYLTAVILNESLLTKMVGRIPNGILIGILTSTSAFENMIGPLILSSLYGQFGTFAANGYSMGLMLVGALLLVIFYKRLL